MRMLQRGHDGVDNHSIIIQISQEINEMSKMLDALVNENIFISHMFWCKRNMI